MRRHGLLLQPSTGIRLRFSTLRSVNGSSFGVVQPGWVIHNYGPVTIPVSWSGRCGRFRWGQEDQPFFIRSAEFNCPFDGVETFILKPDNTFSTSLSYRLTRYPRISNGMWPPWRSIRSRAALKYFGKTGAGSGVIPVQPEGVRPPRASDADFNLLKIESRIGLITIRTQHDAGLFFSTIRRTLGGSQTSRSTGWEYGDQSNLGRITSIRFLSILPGIGASGKAIRARRTSPLKSRKSRSPGPDWGKD